MRTNRFTKYENIDDITKINECQTMTKCLDIQSRAHHRCCLITLHGNVYIFIFGGSFKNGNSRIQLNDAYIVNTNVNTNGRHVSIQNESKSDADIIALKEEHKAQVILLQKQKKNTETKYNELKKQEHILQQKLNQFKRDMNKYRDQYTTELNSITSENHSLKNQLNSQNIKDTNKANELKAQIESLKLALKAQKNKNFNMSSKFVNENKTLKQQLTQQQTKYNNELRDITTKYDELIKQLQRQKTTNTELENKIASLQNQLKTKTIDSLSDFKDNNDDNELSDTELKFKEYFLKIIPFNRSKLQYYNNIYDNEFNDIDSFLSLNKNELNEYISAKNKKHIDRIYDIISKIKIERQNWLSYLQNYSFDYYDESFCKHGIYTLKEFNYMYNNDNNKLKSIIKNSTHFNILYQNLPNNTSNNPSNNISNNNDINTNDNNIPKYNDDEGLISYHTKK